MIRTRPALEGIARYVPGKSAEEVAGERAVLDVVKLASNEAPFPPLPAAVAAIAEAAGRLNRYPDDAALALARSAGRPVRRRRRTGAHRRRVGRALPHGARRHLRSG